MLKVAAAVVLYNPQNDFIDKIDTYINLVDFLYIIDNSSTSNEHLLSKYTSSMRCVYIHNGQNMGISYSLNVCAKLAINSGYDWLLTMDQDSEFHDFSILLNYVISDDERNNVGIYSPFHDTGYRLKPDSAFSCVMSTMTSGNLINLEAFLKIKGFDERFFIDRVDHDYCATLMEHGYIIKQINDCVLNHNLGCISATFLGQEITNHSALRRYYITRNLFYFMQKHIKKMPRYSLRYFKAAVKDIFVVFLCEGDRLNKGKYMLIGFLHYLCRVNGRKP